MAVGPEHDERVISHALSLHGDIYEASRASIDDDVTEKKRILNIASMGALFLAGQPINRGNIEAVSTVTQKVVDQPGRTLNDGDFL